MFSWNLLHRGVKAIFFVQIVNRLGDFVIPFLALILTQVQGLSPAVAGVVVTLATALSSLGGLAAGRLGDKLSRRDVLVVFLSLSGALLFAAGFAPSSPWALAAMVSAEFFLGAMRPLLGALIADLSTPDTRRSAFSLSYLGVNIGVSVGPLLAGWLFTHALSWLFWIDALTTAAALAILVSSVPRRVVLAAGAAPVEGSVPVSSWKAFVRHPVLLAFSLLMLGYNWVYAQMFFTQALQLVDLFGTDGPPLFGVVWAVNAVWVLVLTPLALRWTRSWTNLASMALGQAFILAGLIVFLFHPDRTWVIVSAVMWTTGEVLVSIHFADLVTGHSPVERRARFQAYVGFLGSLGFVFAPVTSGFITQALGLTGVWWMSCLVVAAVGAGMVALDRRPKS
jgi:MFS family permease